MSLLSIKNAAAEAVASATRGRVRPTPRGSCLRSAALAVTSATWRGPAPCHWPRPCAARHVKLPKQSPNTPCGPTRWRRSRSPAPDFSTSFCTETRSSPGFSTGEADSFDSGGGKTIVEHTAINPNKAAHIGHLRNSVLGDVLGRCLRHLGSDVEIQNYIDDTGVQVADVVVGALYLPEIELANVLKPSRAAATS